jgi:hypothetical protein
MGGQQAGQNNALATQGQLNQGADRNALQAYQDAQQAQNQAAQTDIQRKDFTNKNRGTTAQQALVGALLGGGLQPTHVSPTGSSGGVMNSLNANPDALAAMKLFAQQASQAQNTPLQFQGGQILAPPKLTATPQLNANSSGLTKTLQILGALGAGGITNPQGSGSPSGGIVPMPEDYWKNVGQQDGN